MILYRNDRAFDYCEVKNDANHEDRTDSESPSHGVSKSGIIYENRIRTDEIVRIYFLPIENALIHLLPACCHETFKKTSF